MWPSTTKYFSPFFSYTLSPDVLAESRASPTSLRRCGREVKAEIVRGVLRVGDEDSPVVGVDHPAVVGGHVLLELGLVERAGLLTQGLGDLVVDDLHGPDRVDADHRWQRHHPHVRLGGHDLRYDLAYLIVHQREAAPAGRGAVGLERALGGLECGHWDSSFGASRLSAVTIPVKRLLAASRPSSKRGGLASGCDHTGWSVRAAEIARGTQVASHCCMIALLWSANSPSSVRTPNLAAVYRQALPANA